MRALQGFNLFGKEMKISYAKGKSDTIAKLDGTYRMPTIGVPAGAIEATELQQSIFNAPPGAAAISAPPKDTAGMALKPPPVPVVEDGAKSPQGVKRRREEEDVAESDEDDAPMEEGDSDASMEDSSDEE
ncbi:MAG: U2 snRNP complex subunit msl1 [Geoglossum simile]|nr:MAG: U2 snRNP complex subunit msl1 [Geoglossum simile]